MTEIGDLFLDITCTPNGNRLFVATSVQEKPRFGKPDKLMSGRLYHYNREGNLIFAESSMRWLSSMKARIGRVRDINLNVITRNDVME